MKTIRLEITYLLIGLLGLTTVRPACAQPESTGSIEQARFRDRLFPSGRLFNGRGDEESGDRRRDADVEMPPAMVEPVKMPVYRGPVPGRQTASSQTQEGQASDPLLELVQRAIDVTSMRHLDVNSHTPWQIMHATLALRTDLQLKSGNTYVRGVDWLSSGPMFRNQHWFEATQYGGQAHPFNVPFHFEGHRNQFLALLAFANLPLNHEFKVAGGRTVTMADMINNAKMTVNTREEITWTLWFLTHYIDQDSEWETAAGQPWSMEDLVRIQTQASVKGAPCGGTHGLFALAYARNAYLQKHHKLRGAWFDADQKVRRYIEVAKSLQNSDGSFSTEFFTGPGHSRDYNDRIKASGHTLECLMMMMPQSQLSENWLRRGVASVATDLIHTSTRPTECGPTFHALSALVFYRDRMTPRPPANLAQQTPVQPDESGSAPALDPEVTQELPSVAAEPPKQTWRARQSTPDDVIASPPTAETLPETKVADRQPDIVTSPVKTSPAPVPQQAVIDSKPIIAQQPLPPSDTTESDTTDEVPPPLAAPIPDLIAAQPAPPALNHRRSRLTRRAADRAADIARRVGQRIAIETTDQPIRR